MTHFFKRKFSPQKLFASISQKKFFLLRFQTNWKVCDKLFQMLDLNCCKFSEFLAKTFSSRQLSRQVRPQSLQSRVCQPSDCECQQQLKILSRLTLILKLERNNLFDTGYVWASHTRLALSIPADYLLVLPWFINGTAQLRITRARTGARSAAWFLKSLSLIDNFWLQM